MKICVINGSPKARYSVTLQTFLYIQKHCSDIEATIIDVAAKIKYYEQNIQLALDEMQNSDLVIFSYPVYTFTVPYQLHRFIELLKTADAGLSDKFATQISTSKHFYDITAHRFIEDNLADLGMKYIDGLSADMEDLLKPVGQRQSLEFYEYVKYCMQNDIYKRNKITSRNIPAYAPLNIEVAKRSDKKIAIVADLSQNDPSLNAMITDFQKYLPYNSYVVNIADFAFQGGCLGCFKCAVSGKCVYTDGFADMLRDKIHSADAIVYAFSIKDHSMGSVFKIYDDRQFCNGHRTVTMGKPAAFIISGDYYKEDNLQKLTEARCQVGQNYFAGVITDSDSLQSTAKKLEFAVEHHYCPPQNFWGVGGMKIFRDLIYTTGGMMKADYAFYKQNGFFDDMPHRQHKSRIMMKLVGAMLSNKKLVSKLGNKLAEGMIAPYKKVISRG